MMKIGKVIRVNEEEALIKLKNKTSKVNISLIKNIRVGDKIICFGNVAVERVENED